VTRTVATPPVVAGDALVFSVPDPGRELRRVALVHELVRPRVVPFRCNGGGFELCLPRPPVDRLEYLLERERRTGHVELGPDPANELVARGPFGPKSVVEFPQYRAPAWVSDEESQPGEVRELRLASRMLRTTVKALLWSAAETDPRQPLPLLVVHDGPEYAEYSSLLRLLDHLVAFGEVPPLRAALISPPLDRLETYTASARYARALTEEWLPMLRPYAARPVGLGASMGALALLHAHYAKPHTFGGLLLQSGAFFRHRFDSHEAGLSRYARVTRFVSRAGGGRSDVVPVPITLTCGTGEENLANNRWLAETLGGRGWPIELVEHRDAHNWISWRDVLHPSLTELILRTLE
jgi:enterochelin esterase family protein